MTRPVLLLSSTVASHTCTAIISSASEIKKAFLFRGRLSVILLNIQVLSNFPAGENLLCALCMFHYLLHCGRESNYEKLLHQKNLQVNKHTFIS